MNELITIIILSILLVGQAVERYFYAKDMTNRLSESMKAVMSRNINEFLLATKPDNKPEASFIQDDQVPIDELTPDEYEKFISNQL